jgi:decaprenylphospho-beta-D-ribofuranose 2-oxidase
MSTQPLHGWGRTSPSTAHVTRAADEDALRSTVVAAGDRGVLVRGLGRSYGDAAQNAGGDVLDLTGWSRLLDLDVAEATVTVEAGASLDALMRALLPFGLWLPVIPGTRQVTVGGAVAADVHGKNHHVRGSFGDHVRSMDLLLATGDVVTVGPDGPDADLFWATVGGMGLTGVVLRVTLGLKRVESSYFLVDTDREPHLDGLLTSLSEGDDRYEYSVAWFDTATTGSSLGRAVVTRGDQATRDQLPDDRRADALAMSDRTLARVPFTFPDGVVNRFSARAFNALWYAKAPQHRRGELQNITQFFHPLDVVADWNRVYGSRGFCQYQFVVPFGQEDAFRTAVRMIAESDHVSSLNVLKRFGEGNRGLLSFPTSGWTLAVDLPVRPGLDRLLRALDRVVLDAGGRLYLAKDSRADAATIARMYPRLDAFAAVRDRVDPQRRFRSDLARRLDL